MSDFPADDGVLTLEYLEGVLAKLRREPLRDIHVAPARLPERDDYIPHLDYRFSFMFGPRVFVSPHLPDEQPRKLTRRERFWLWVESLCDRAEIYYYGPRIKRTEPAPAYLIGRDLYIPRRAAAALYQGAKEPCPTKS